ncbi:RES family NAD+ phosphorylase [Negadavirga shengliensis]|uniref:RES family NAD+ phosphorylase n=1 Tax=Negadavirga shengliensis TaxID=1389218 RepID=A0ABV9SV61_9BACT
MTKGKHVHDSSGIDAAQYPGRWNRKGTPVLLLYTGKTIEIALLKNIVHLPPMIAPKLDLLTIEIPDDSIAVISPSELPANWSHYPAPTVLSEVGQKWIDDRKTVALQVPSSIIHSSTNVLLNCLHPGYGEVRVLRQEKFRFDSRLMK